MIQCKDVVKLVASDQFRSQRLMMRLEVRFHLWLRRYCSRWERQIKQLGSAARKVAGRIPVEHVGKLDDDLEARLLRKLSEKGKGK